MQEIFQPYFNTGIREDGVTHFFPVKTPFIVEEIRAEFIANLIEGGLARLYDLVCNQVGVNNGNATFGE